MFMVRADRITIDRCNMEERERLDMEWLEEAWLGKGALDFITAFRRRAKKWKWRRTPTV